MNHLGRAAILLVLGVMVLRLIITGGFGWFVQQGMRIPLLAAGIVLLMLGAVEYFLSTRKPSAADTEAIDEHTAQDHDGDEKHSTAGPRIGWLLVAPLAVLIAVAPTGLGAAAADRVDALVPTDNGRVFEPLTVVDGPVQLTVFEFLNRAVWDEQRSLENVPVLLSGLVVNDPEIPDGFKLTRFLVSCCAADGLPVQVAVRGVTDSFENDTWVEVVGEWVPTEVAAATDGATPELAVQSITVTTAPNNPYESW